MLLPNVAVHRQTRGWSARRGGLGVEMAGPAMRRTGARSSGAAGLVGVRDSGLPAARLEDPRHREQIIHHMRSGFLPLKYAYAGSAAYTHDALARTAGYAEVVGEAGFEAETLFRTLPALRVPAQIAEVGPGNGVHSAAFLDALGRGTPRRLRYLGLDFSATLLGLAMEHIGTQCPQVERNSAHWDLEAGGTGRIAAWRRPGSPVLVCLLGHTLGNLEDPVQALRNLAISTAPGDLLLLGLSLMPPGADAEAVLAPYRNDVFSDAVLEPLRAAAADVRGACVRLDLRVHGGGVLGEAVFTRPVNLGGFAFDDRDVVRCFTSARYRPDYALGLLHRAGWRVCGWELDGGATHMAVVARR
jgi:L-histidine N-alpha-methyltransferase